MKDKISNFCTGRLVQEGLLGVRKFELADFRMNALEKTVQDSIDCKIFKIVHFFNQFKVLFILRDEDRTDSTGRYSN